MEVGVMPRRVSSDWPRSKAAHSLAGTDRLLHTVTEGLRGDVRFNAPLKEWTSFRIGGPADVLVMPLDLDDVCRLMRQADETKVPVFVLGGTNLLVRDGGIRGIVVSLSQMKNIRDESDAVLYADGGVTMPTLLQHAIGHSLTGLEWAAGIPGTVAGCVVMNAGTRLGEMKDSLKTVCLVGAGGILQEIPATAISFTYRHARLPDGIVAGVRLQLKPGVKEQIQAVVKDYLHYRKDTQPLMTPNAGCAFKNPQTASAGHLIETAGLKGFRVGDAQVSEKHANFIVNLGNARADDVLQLMAHVVRTVQEKTGVTLELEVKVVGEP